MKKVNFIIGLVAGLFPVFSPTGAKFITSTLSSLLGSKILDFSNTWLYILFVLLFFAPILFVYNLILAFARKKSLKFALNGFLFNILGMVASYIIFLILAFIAVMNFTPMS